MVVTISKTSKNYWLAATLPLPILENSRRRHIQRFLSLDKLNVLALWFPIIKQVLSRQIKAGSQLIIALDRTQWKENNVLMVSAIHQKRALDDILDVVR